MIAGKGEQRPSEPHRCDAAGAETGRGGVSGPIGRLLLQSGTRSLLPVVVLEGRAWAIVGYEAAEEQAGARLLVTDGTTETWWDEEKLLVAFRASGAVFGHLKLARK